MKHADYEAETRLAWAAGLFEGEGCISAARQNRGLGGVDLWLGMVDRDVVERFRDVVGAGTVVCKHPPSQASYQPLWVWRCGSWDDAERILSSFMPYFGERRANRARAALANPAGSAGRPFTTHCKHGHPKSGDNLYVSPDGIRHCKTCQRAASRSYAERVGRVTTTVRGLDGGNGAAVSFPPSSPSGSTSDGAGGLAAASAARTAEAPAPSEDAAAGATPLSPVPAAATLFDLPAEPDWA